LARNRFLKIVTYGFLLGVVGVNMLAFMHAKAMTEFKSVTSRTESPENLAFSSKVKVLLTGVKVPRPENHKSPEDFEMRFEEHRFLGANENMLEAWHIPSLGGDVLVLLFHGYSSSKDTLLPIAKQLNSLGMSTLLVDFYGSGGSEGSGTSIGYLESIDVNESVQYAKEKWPGAKIILYGQSMGSAAILRSIAIHDTDPDAIIIESTYDKMISTVKNRFSAMGIPSVPLSELLVLWGGWQFGFNAFKHNPADYAKSVTCPTLVIHGLLDPRVTESQAEAVYDELDSWKQFSIYPSAGHLAAMNSDLMQWKDDVNFLVSKIQAP